MSITSKDLPFPILMLGPGGVGLRLYVAPENMIERELYIKHSPTNGKIRVIANDLKTYSVSEFLDSGGVEPFWGIRFGGPYLLYRRVRFAVVLTTAGNWSGSELLNMYCSTLEYGKGIVSEFRKRFLERIGSLEFSVANSYPLYRQLALEIYYERKARRKQTTEKAMKGRTKDTRGNSGKASLPSAKSGAGVPHP